MSRCEDDRCQPAVPLELDLRLGAGGPAPRQAHGPVSVNLFNGNAALTLASPAMQTVGGEVGLSLNYNSGVQRATGLTTSYYDDLSDSGAIGAREVPAQVSTLPALTANWGAASPAPGAVGVAGSAEVCAQSGYC